MSLSPRDVQGLSAARLYYERGLSQGDVARELGVSRPTVSKLIQHAKDRGFVTIEIHDPRQVSTAVADQLCERFGLAQARVITSQPTNEELLRELGAVGALMLKENVADGDLVGITWGRTLHAVARSLKQQNRHGVQVVQLKGGATLTSRSTSHYETIRSFCEAFNAYPQMLPLPVIFDNAEVKRLVEEDRHIKHILDLGRDAKTAIFTVGTMSPESTLLKLGYLSEAEQTALLDNAVGDICSRFIDEHGEPCLPELEERTVAVSLQNLRAKQTRICVAGGQQKVRPLKAALGAGYVSHLVTDEDTARAVLV
ncbi:sugar-binding transcriptional regulator [Kocuria carniphila]|uniref:sugar-binding transcriptional regulator n=1 Tax=Kocuria carniphila TaxID=262208 RepID=UPI0028EB1656|nr:sugar-binding transcriptional regulator [Kocuria carniphila]